ncbi:uncharacterized protein LOC141631813 [Silene latifolia]|uniref:uncharacterized protein LOC141631813 n=1 Tax=Silene latifolia TaxID=37657 RepID=UPI003D76F732
MAIMTFIDNQFSPLASSSKLPRSYTNTKNQKNKGMVNSTAEKVPQTVSAKETTQGPQTGDAKKTVSLGSIVGFPVLNLDEGVPNKPDSGWLLRQGGNNIVMEIIVEEEEQLDLLKFTPDDIKSEVEFWNQSVYCYILGTNPPMDIVEDYVYQAWSEFGIDKVSFVENGVFLVRFTKPAGMSSLLNVGYYFFDNKPIVIKPWSVDVDLVKEKIDVAPVWVRLTGVPLKFRGDYLVPIAGLVGNFVRKDIATTEKKRLSYARVLVELKMDQHLPDKIQFLDENGNVVVVQVTYEWRPVSCEGCKGFGHDKQQCTKAKPKVQPKGKPNPPPEKQKRQTWRPVQKQVDPPRAKRSIVFSPEGFPPLVRPSVTTPAMHIMKLNKQGRFTEIIASGRKGPLPFLDALNGTTPRRGVMQSGLFGLLETKIKPRNLLNKSSSLCEGWSITTNSSWHKGGRIWVLWKPELFIVNVLNYNAQYIHMRVTSRTDDNCFLLTMIYAHNDFHERVELWTFLKHVALTCNESWLWAGDFNTVLSPVERLRGHTSEAEMQHFQECVSLCCVEDLQATRAMFTWSNNENPVDRVYSRQDRVMGNNEWMLEYGDYLAHFHPEGVFDHCPCTIVNKKADMGRRKSFNYFNMWGKSELFLPCVKKIWCQVYQETKMFSVVKKLKALKLGLKALNKDYFSDIENSTTLTAALLEKNSEGFGGPSW